MNIPQKLEPFLQLDKLPFKRCRNIKQAKKIAQKGVTLIELMVALVIGLVVSLAVYSVLNASEGRKRATTSINDIDQAGSFAVYQLDKALRSAGSGFSGGLNPAREGVVATAAEYTYACRLLVRLNANTLLPMQALFGLPFVNVPQNLTLAPLVIMNNAATDGVNNRGDVLISMSGSGGLSESITNLTVAPNTGQLEVNSEASLRADDLLLIATADKDNAAPPIVPQDCPIQQVAPGFMPSASPDVVRLGGVYNNNGGALAAFNDKAVLLNLGRAPSFNMFAVGANNILFKYDLLQAAAGAGANDPNPSEFVDSVFRMEAIYGINPNGVPGNFAWQEPINAFDGNALLAGNAAANANLRRITMVRIALIMQTSIAERNAVNPAVLTLFNGTGLQRNINVNPNFRYRVIETTIPIRNALLR